MKTVRSVVLLMVCGLTLCGRAWAADADASKHSAQEIAAKPELIVTAIQGQTAENAAAIVAQALTAIFSSDLTDAKKRENVIALIAYAVATMGPEAAPMMGLVAAGAPPSWLPVIAATAVVAAGNDSPAVAQAMLDAVAGNAELVEACRAACANPSTVLSQAEMAIILGIALQTPAQTTVKAPPLPTNLRRAQTHIRSAVKYSGQ